MDLRQTFAPSPEKPSESIIRFSWYSALLLLLWMDFFVPLLPGTVFHRRTYLYYFYPAEKVLLGVFVVCSWLIWSQAANKFTVPKFRSWAGFLSLLAGTLSFLPYAVLVSSMLLTTPHRFFSSDIRPLYILGISLSVCTFVSSFFGRGKIRIAGLTIGFILLTKWLGVGMALKESGRWP